MESTKQKFNSIDEYIASFPDETQSILQTIRKTIQAAAPDAKEIISYQMPTFYLNGNLVHFAAYKKHIGFYPIPSGIAAFEEELSQYKRAKGSVQFPINEAMPLDLISRIVQFRVADNAKKVAEKASKKKKMPSLEE